LEETRRKEVDWKEKEQVWVSAPTNSTSGGWEVNLDDQWWVASDEKLFTTFYAMSRGIWPSVEGGVEVVIDVHSVLEGPVDKECSTCRLLVFVDCLSVIDLLSFLHYTTIGTSDGSCTSLGPYGGPHLFVVSC
jgi:hypothetical protein